MGGSAPDILRIRWIEGENEQVRFLSLFMHRLCQADDRLWAPWGDTVGRVR